MTFIIESQVRLALSMTQTKDLVGKVAFELMFEWFTFVLNSQ